MSRCVPGWDLDETLNLTSQSNSFSLTPDVPTLDYEVAELTWENGHLSMHGLGQPRLPYNIWDKPWLGGTLESIVDQASFFPNHKSVGDATNELVPAWTTTTASATITASVTEVMAGLVPCTDNSNMVEGSSMLVMNSVRQVESCQDTTVLFEKLRVAPPKVAVANRDKEFKALGIASSGKQCTGNDYNSVCQSKPQRVTVHEGKKKKTNEKSSFPIKRRRAAAIHNQSERERRDKINQRMKTLQEMVPNSSKIDKASMLEEVIEYMKQLQTQVTMMSRMNMSLVTLPNAMQQQLQMSIIAPMMAMGMGHVTDMNTAMAGRPNMVAASPSVLHQVDQGLHTPASVMHNSMSAFLAACQSQPMTMDAYSRMATLYQHMHQNPGPGVMK